MTTNLRRFAAVGALTLFAVTATDAAAESTAEPNDAGRPVLVGDQFVSPLDGRTFGRVAGGLPYKSSVPVPGVSGEFRHNDLFVEADGMTSTPAGILVVHDEDQSEDSIVRLGDGGTPRWSHPIDLMRPPAWAEGNGVVAVTVRDGLVGIEDASGREIWRSAGRSGGLVAAHGLVAATESGHYSKTADNPVIARRLTDGSEAWRAVMPEGSDPEPTLVAGDLFLVREHANKLRGSWTRAFLVDGSPRFVLDSEAVEAAQQVGVDGEIVVVSETRTARISRDGRELWRVDPPFLASMSGNIRGEGYVSGAGIYPLSDGSLLVEAHNVTGDTGVNLARIDSSSGATVWRVHAEGIGGGHSAYWQRVYVEIRGTDLVLVSQAIGGHFVERRSIADGALIQRWRFGLD